MKNLKKRVLALSTACAIVGTFPMAVFAEEQPIESAEVTLQYEELSTYSLYIPSVLDITNGNCIGIQNANIADDKEVYIRVSSTSFNENNEITMSKVSNNESTISVSLMDANGQKVTAENNLLCTISDGTDYSTFIQGVCNDSGVQAGKYRGIIYIDTGIRDKQQ